MTLYRVPAISDYPMFRGNFLFSTMKSELVYLDAKGHIHLFKDEIQSAILAVFMEREVRPEKEFRPEINAPVRCTVSIETDASSFEWIAKALRG